MSTSRLPSGPWCAFGASLISAVGTMVTGTLAARLPGFDWALIGFYCLFVFTFGTFVYLCIDDRSDLTSFRCLYYFVMIVLTIIALTKIASLQSDVLYAYIPISCDVGVYLALGLGHLWSQLNSAQTRHYLIRHLTLPSERLPQWEPRSSQLQP